jgi:hypothetical protein
LFEYKGWIKFGWGWEGKGKMVLIFRLGFAVLVHDIGATLVPLVVTTSTSVGEPLRLLQVIDSVSPGLRVIDNPLAGSEVIDTPLLLPFRYAVQLDALEPLGTRFIASTVMALTPIAFTFTTSTPPNSSAVTVNVLLAPSDGIAPWKT